MCSSDLLEKYGKAGLNDKRKDILIREKFSDAEIYALIADKTTKKDRILDNIIGFVTDAPFGIPQLINQINDMDNAYYLVINGEKQFLTVVTSEFIESRELSEKVKDKKFVIGDVPFKKLRKI